jgi:hypothetical protein
MLELKISLLIVNLILGFVVSVLSIFKSIDYYKVSRRLKIKLFKKKTLNLYYLILLIILDFMCVIISIVPLSFIAIYCYYLTLNDTYTELRIIEDEYDELTK